MVPAFWMIGIAVMIVAACSAARPPRLSDEQRDEIVQTVCGGGAYAEAAKYPGDEPPHLMLVDSGEIRFDWRAGTIGDVELVGCVEIDGRTVQTCTYTGGYVERRQYDIAITLREAATGESLSSTVIYGPLPPGCPDTKRDLSSIGGPPYEELEAWLERYVMAGG